LTTPQPEGLTDEQLRALQEQLDCYRADQHPAYLATYTKIRDETTGRVMTFDLWDWQTPLLSLMLTEKYLIILKGRQLGVSWLAALLALFEARKPTRNVLILSQGEQEARNLLDKVNFLLVNLPGHLRPHVLKKSSQQIQFGYDPDPVSGEYRQTSKITALPATKDAGRGETASLVIADEWAFHPNAETNFVALQPTIDAGTARFVAISTANGSGNFFATTYKLAQRGENSFHRVFLPYSLRPGRDLDWYEQKKRDYKATPLLMHQEFPRDEDEAFIASGGSIFDLMAIRELEKAVEDPLPFEAIWQSPTLQYWAEQGLHVWRPYHPRHTYVAWLDPATTIHGGDYASFQVWDVQTREQAAAWHGKQEDDWLAQLATEVSRAYGLAFLSTDRTGIGQSVTNSIINHFHYPRDRFYHHRDSTVKKSQQGEKKLPGCPMSSAMNAYQESLGRQAIAHQDVIIHEAGLIQELRTLVEDPDTHRVEAKAPDHDDRARAFLGILYLMEQPEATRSGRPPIMPSQPGSRLKGRTRRVTVA